MDDATLFKLIKDGGFIPPKDLDRALDKTKDSRVTLSETLIEQDMISDENLGKIISDFYHLPFISLAKTPINDTALNILPESVAKTHHAIVFDTDPKLTKIATSEIDQQAFFDNVAKKSGTELEVYYATQRDIQNGLAFYKQALQDSFDDLIRTKAGGDVSSGIQDLPIDKILNLLIEYAYTQRASDIHIEPEEDTVVIRFRIDGVLRIVLKAPKSLHEQIISLIKVDSKLRTDEHLSAQDGKMVVKLPDEDLDIRVSIVPIVAGEKCVMRLLSSRSRQFGLSDLGFKTEDLKIVKKAFTRPFGMILATGPTGSGKTTSIYSILKILNTHEKNIATIEDPVEYEIEGINQIQVNDKTNLTFAAGLRSILRQDPDIIFVGEIRDEETASIAVNSAMTGHLVLSTLHTNDAATAIPRLYDMKIEPFLISSTVNVIIAQRLVRKICEKCKVSVNVASSEFADFFPKDLITKYFAKPEVRIYKGKGCQICHTSGYVGRVGIFEVLHITPAIQKLITAKSSSDDIRALAIQEGMTTMMDDGLSKVAAGVTTVAEIIRAVRE